MPRQLLPTAQTGPNNHIYNMSISFSMLATATDLSEGLATRQLAQRTISDQRSDKEQQGNSNRVLANVRRLFSLHRGNPVDSWLALTRIKAASVTILQAAAYVFYSVKQPKERA